MKKHYTASVHVIYLVDKDAHHEISFTANKKTLAKKIDQLEKHHFGYIGWRGNYVTVNGVIEGATEKSIQITDPVIENFSKTAF